MFGSEHQLRHLPFFEELAAADEGSAEWRAFSAGLVVMRAIDAVLDEPTAAEAARDWSLQNIAKVVSDMDPGSPTRDLLGRVFTVLETGQPTMQALAAPLLAYGQALEYEAKWKLASDVYTTLLARLHPTADADSTIPAHFRLAQCYRTLGQLDGAAETYRSAGRIATTVGDLVGALRARVGEGNILMLRGNLPQAEEILDEAVAEARDPRYTDVRARVLHERANVAHYRKQYERAIQFAYEALGQSQRATERDRILADIAVSFLDLGIFTAARDAYLVLSVTAQEQFTRWSATLNLLEIASLTGVEPLFELYRRQLSAVDLPPILETGYHLSLGCGYRQFGDLDKAEHHVRSAIELAASHGYSQYLFEAEEALRQLQTPALPPRMSAAAPLDIEEVAEAIRDLRLSSGVAG